MFDMFDSFYEITDKSISIGTEKNHISVSMEAIYAVTGKREWTLLEENELNGEVLYVVLTATREKVSSCDREITIKWGIRRESRPAMSNTYRFKGLPSGKLVEVNCD
jgi:hypothetical protein